MLDYLMLIYEESKSNSKSNYNYNCFSEEKGKEKLRGGEKKKKKNKKLAKNRKSQPCPQLIDIIIIII